ncbi:MAG: SAM-dependent methyltransferase [Planctomycetota bacterium]|nr:SAM-dependent methyltransferase [Planctomycetota bacterium]
MSSGESHDAPYVSRGGLKLQHALSEFALDVRGLTCADLGCSTGGFTDCLLRAGAAKVYSVDTAYGQLAWTLRNDPRVVVMERTNALHAEPRERVALVTIDVSWTPQRLALPAAAKWLACKGGAEGHGGSIVTLIKPHYERSAREPGRRGQGGGRREVVLSEHEALDELERTLAEVRALGLSVIAHTRSPITGGAASGNKAKGTGNVEFLALVKPMT